MKQEILAKIAQLGGNTDHVQGLSLQDDLLAITFDTVLYPRPQDTPWQTAPDAEPIFGIGQFINDNAALFQQDKPAFYDKIVQHYFCLTEEGCGQFF